MKKSTIINIAYSVITLSGIAIFAYLEYTGIISHSSYGLLFVALMITLRNLLLKKLS